MVDLTTISAILKKDILPAVTDAVKDEAIIYNIAKKKLRPQKIINNKFYEPVKLGMSSGVTAWGSSGVPTLNKGAISPVQAEFGLNQYAASFSIDQVTLDAGKGAVVDALTLQSEGAKDSLVSILNLNLYRNGGNSFCVAATGTGTGTSTTLKLKSGRTQDNGDIDFAKYIPVGSKIQIGSSTSNVAIVTKWSGKNTVTLDTALTWSADDAIYVLADNAKQNYMEGLLSIVGTGAYAGINPANYYAWRSYVDTPGSGAITLAITDIDKAHLEANSHGGDVKYTITNKTLYTKFLDILKSNPTYMVTEKNVFHGGYVGVDYMGHDFIYDPACPDDVVFNISPKELALAELHPLEFLPAENGILKRAYGKTEWEAIAYTSLGLITYNRAAHSMIEQRKAS